MTDYEELKDRMEMAELLEDFGDSWLDFYAFNSTDDNKVRITLLFNEVGELINSIYTEK